MRRPLAPVGRARVAALLLIVLATAACGVPISAKDLDLTATVEPTESAASAPASSRSAAVSTAPETPTATVEAASPTPTVAISTTPGPSPTASFYATPVPPPSTANMAADVIQILNSYRVSQGLAALSPNATLSAAAVSYARLMASYSWFLNYRSDPHSGPDGSTPESRVIASGYAGRWRGEALSAGQTSAQAAVNTWLASPPHAAILLDPYAVEVGVGYYFRGDDVYGHYWVLVTGIP